MRTPTESKTFARLPVPDGCLDDCETIIVSVNGRKRNWQTSNPRRREFRRPQREQRETRLLSPLSRPLSRRSTQLSQQATRQQQRRASARLSARSRWQLPRASCTRTLLPARCLASRSLSQQSADRCHRTKAKAERNSALLFFLPEIAIQKERHGIFLSAPLFLYSKNFIVLAPQHLLL